MSHFYRNSPVSGFTGHVPGARFTVGRRALKTPGREDRERARADRETSERKDTNGLSISSEELTSIPPLPLSRSEFALNQIQYHPDYHGASDYHAYHAAMNQGQGGGGGGGAPPQGYPYPGGGQPMMYPGIGYAGMGASYGNIPAAYNDSMNYTIGYNAHAMPMRIPRDPTEYDYYQGGDQQQQQQQTMRYGDAGETFSSTHDYGGGRQVQHTQQRGGATAAATTTGNVEMKRRSQSMPRRRPDGAPPLKDPFEGLEGGIYSKGEVLRNKERRMLAMQGQPVSGNLSYGNGGGERRGGGGGGERINNFGYEGDEISEEDRARRAAQMEEENDRIPAAGYSGHIPRFRRIGVGKSFNTAAREAKKEFIEDKLNRTSDGSDFDLSRASLGRPSRLDGNGVHQKFDASTGRLIETITGGVGPGGATNGHSTASNTSNTAATNKSPLVNNSSPIGNNHNSASTQQQQQAPDDPHHQQQLHLQHLQQMQQHQLRYGPPPPMTYMMSPTLSPDGTMTMQPYPMYMPYMYAPSSGAPTTIPGAPTAPSGVSVAPSAKTGASGGRFGSGVAPQKRDDVRDDASSVEQLGASVGKVVVSQDGLFANSLIRRADGSVLDITPPGIIRDEEETKDQHQKTVTYEAQTPFGESIRTMRRD